MDIMKPIYGIKMGSKIQPENGFKQLIHGLQIKMDFALRKQQLMTETKIHIMFSLIKMDR